MGPTQTERRVEQRARNLALPPQSASRILGEAKARLKDRKKRKKTIYIAGHNIRTLRLAEHLTTLENELEKIKWDVIGLCETRQAGEAVTILKSGYLLFQKNSDVNEHIGDVALMVNKKIKYLIIKTRAVSESASTDEEYDQFLEDLTTAKNAERTKYSIVTGDFNSKIGKKTITDPSYIGAFGLGERNHRGQTLTDFLSKEKIFCMNTFFEKHK
ncbi:uncharacterized protein [Anoplolepis gracilipes]|uniref:uncharacterized protein n=1 Tax=Anoplolepis gracilipes TaxID=354296 RepID=UPI003B9E2AC6